MRKIATDSLDGTQPTEAQQALVDKWDREGRLMSAYMDKGNVRASIMDGRERREVVIRKNGKYDAPKQRGETHSAKLPDGTPVKVHTYNSKEK